MFQPPAQGDAQVGGIQGENTSQTRRTPQAKGARDNTAGGNSAIVE